MKKYMRMMALLLVLAMGIGFMPVSAEEETSGTDAEDFPKEWTVNNSITVGVNTEEPTVFTPADFPEIDCQAVITVQKTTTDEGEIHYGLVLVLKESGKEAVEKAIEAAEKDSRINDAGRNRSCEQCDYQVFLNHSAYTLRLGETVDVKITNIIEPVMYQTSLGIWFDIDDTIIDNSHITKDSFQEYGILQFCPRPQKNSISFPLENEGERSEEGYYFAAINPEFTCFEMVDRLAREPGMTDVQAFMDPVPGGYDPVETWTIDNPSLAQMTLSGGYIIDRYDTTVRQTATIKALQPGMVTVTVGRSYYDGRHFQTCSITILDEYQPGDVNRDGDIAVADALLALQAATQKIMLNEEEKGLADYNLDGFVDAEDALLILQMATAKIKEFS